MKIQKTITIEGAKYTGHEILTMDRYETNGGDWLVEIKCKELIYSQHADFISIKNHGIVHRFGNYGDVVALLEIPSAA